MVEGKEGCTKVLLRAGMMDPCKEHGLGHTCVGVHGRQCLSVHGKQCLGVEPPAGGDVGRVGMVA